MKKLIYNLLMAMSILVVMGSGLMGIFTAMGICAVIWGEGILSTALGSPPDRSHPAFWLGFAIALPGMLIGYAGGIVICQAIQALAKWKLNNVSEAEAFAKLKHWLKGP